MGPPLHCKNTHNILNLSTNAFFFHRGLMKAAAMLRMQWVKVAAGLQGRCKEAKGREGFFVRIAGALHHPAGCQSPPPVPGPPAASARLCIRTSRRQQDEQHENLALSAKTAARPPPTIASSPMQSRGKSAPFKPPEERFPPRKKLD